MSLLPCFDFFVLPLRSLYSPSPHSLISMIVQKWERERRRARCSTVGTREPLSSPTPLSVCYSIAERDTKFASQPPRGSRAGLQSGGAKFLTVDTNLLVSVDLGEIGFCPLPCKASVEAARQG